MSKRSLLITTMAVVGVWQLAAVVLATPIVPDVVAVARALVRGLTGSLGAHLLASTGRVLAAVVATTVLATPLGLAVGQSQTWNRRLSALIYLTYPIPKVVFLPIILLAMGLGDASKIFFITLILFYQVLIVVRDSAAGIHPDLVQSVASLGATRGQLVRYVYFPACVPAVLTGLRLSTGTAIAVLFLAESIAASSGVGYYIMVEGWGRMAYADMYAGVVALSALGLLLYAALDALETRLCAWRTPPGTYVA
jgi:ABC-type nitrate/sulfonate/bicarbonate transport system permease component